MLPGPRQQGFCKPVTCSCFPSGLVLSFPSGLVQDDHIHLSSSQSKREHNPVTIETWMFLWTFSAYYIFKKRERSLICSLHNTVTTPAEMKNPVFILNQCSSSQPLSFPLFRDKYSMAWPGNLEPWDLSNCHLPQLIAEQSNRNSTAIAMSPLCRAAQQPMMDQEQFPSGAICSFSPPLLKNCLIKISRVQLQNTSLGRTKPYEKQ